MSLCALDPVCAVSLVQQMQRWSRWGRGDVVALGGRMHDLGAGLAIIDAFLTEPFSGDERHVRRIAQLADYESRVHDAAAPAADPTDDSTSIGA